uniref:solute carrier organic anion transporter family member 4A1-like n=1 Tax=Styela clava TaxID=7725 RepID=UPI00193AD592|nr:solute carrier organic anion transporter family member 4A1-like [Styela clava]
MEKIDYESDVDETCGCQINCGCIKFRRRPLNQFERFNNSKGALLVFCLAFLIHTAVSNGLLIAVLTTLEKRFHLTSNETGFIFVCYDIGVISSILVVTYIGGKGHKPLWLGWGCFIVGLSFLLFALPHFIAPNHVVSDSTSSVCDINNTAHCEESSLRSYRSFFIAASFFNGVGSSPFYTLGITYLDANVKQSMSSTYNGIIYGATSVGPALGFVLGGFLLTFYTNITENVLVNDGDAEWIGNWWLGFVMAGMLILLLSVPIMMFPKQLPNSEKFRFNREDEIHQIALTTDENRHNVDRFRNVLRSLITALSNPVLLFLSIAAAFDCGVMTSVVLFGPKYIESMFGISSSTSGIYCGIIAIICATTSYVGGGVLISKFKMKLRQMLKLCIVCSVLSVGIYMIYLLRCEKPPIAGYGVSSGNNILRCKSVCGCTIDTYSPICTNERMTYLSHCDMNCIYTNTGAEGYYNCTVLQRNITVKSGRCINESCYSRGYIFLIVAGLGLFTTFLKAMPGLQTSLRSVPFNQRSFSIGVQWTIIRLLGQIPMPIITGKILDLTCLVWDKECGECGACKDYDNQSMSIYLTLLHTIPLALGGFCYMGALKVYKPPKMEKKESDSSKDKFNTSSN